MLTSPRKLIVFQEGGSDTDYYQELAHFHWQLYIAHDLNDALELVKNHEFLTGLCLINKHKDDSYLDQLKKLFNYAPKIHWVMALPKEIHLDGSIDSQEIQLIAENCHDFIILPASLEKLLFSLGHAYGMAEISSSHYSQIAAHKNVHGLIGNSSVMCKLFKQIDKLSKEDFAVLIEGETGTGKELVAHAIHANSHRADKPIVAINCGAFPADLIQSELFGHEKGAFTGAYQRKIGRIESAQGGTLFLDEIGDLPIDQQVNLLRFLEEKSIERIGGNEKIPIDVRIIAATHVDLKNAVQSGQFREDLYYRLRVLQMITPPLREREHDIELLALYFFDEFSKKVRRMPKGFSEDALYALYQHDWPGNIRELMNCIRNAVIMSENRLLTVADLGLEKRKNERIAKSLEKARADADREAILNSIKQARYNMTRAAQDLGISRVSLYRLIEKYGLKI